MKNDFDGSSVEGTQPEKEPGELETYINRNFSN